MTSWRPREVVKPKKLSAKAWGLWLQKLAEMFLASGGALAIFGEEDDSLRLCAGHNLDLKTQGLVLKTGGCSLGRAASQGRPCILGPWPEEKMRLAGGRAIAYAAAAPVVWGDKIWGAIGVFRAGGEGHFEERDLSILATMGEMAALQFVAGEEPEMGHEGKEPREHLKGIEEARRSLGLAFDVDSAVKAALDMVTDLFEASNASVMLVDKDDYLVIKAARGIPEDVLRGARQKLGEGISGWVAQTRQPLLLNGAVDDPRFSPTNPATKAAMSIPLHSGDKVYGVLNVSHVTSSGAFHQEDIEALVGIGDGLAIAIENARRYAQVEEDRKLALALYELSRAVACSRSDQETLNVVTEMVASYMAAPLCLILGLDEKQECLYLCAGHGLGSLLPAGVGKEIASLSLMSVIRERKTKLLSRTEMGASEVLSRAGDIEYFLAAPLIAPQGVMGVIVIGRPQGQTFGPGDSTLFSALARIAAIALSSATAEEKDKEAIVGRERNRIAQEIHDGLAQEMTSTVLALEACQRFLKKDAKGAEAQLARAISEARSCLADVRRYMTTLRSTGETEVGLVARLQRLVEEFGQQTGKPAEFRATGTGKKLAMPVERALARIGQEALMNVKKHAQARRVTADLEFNEGHVTLTIADDGIGFSVAEAEEQAAKEGKYGLLGMHERAGSIGAELTMESAPGRGSRVRVIAPYSSGNAVPQVASLETPPEPVGGTTGEEATGTATAWQRVLARLK